MICTHSNVCREKFFSTDATEVSSEVLRNSSPLKLEKGSQMCKDFFFSTQFSKKRKLSDLLITMNFLLSLRCASKKLNCCKTDKKTDK